MAHLLRLLAQAGILSVAAASAVQAGGPVLAEEPAPAAAPAATNDWSGYFIGLASARPSGDNAWDLPALEDHALVPDSWTGRLTTVTLGHDWQRGRLTFGTAISRSNGEITAAPQPGIYLLCNDCNTIVSDLTTLRARAGIAAGKTHLFATGGYARADVAGTSGGGQTTVNGATLTGWTLGLGVERQISSRLSLTASYDHTDLGTITLDRHVPGTIAEIDFDLMQFGLTYRW